MTAATIQELWASSMKMSSGRLVRKKRMSAGLSMDLVVERAGYRGKATLSLWENDKKLPSLDFAVRVLGVLDTSEEETREALGLLHRERLEREARFLEQKTVRLEKETGLDLSDSKPGKPEKLTGPGLLPIPGGMVLIPILGTVPGGEPIEADPSTMDSPESHIMLPGVLIVDREMTFALWVRGDSMTGRAEDGDIVVVHRGAMPENGEMAVVRLHHEVTVKAVEFINGITLLRSTNPNIPPTHVTDEDKDGFEIVGKVIGVYNQNP
jgi:SOS-response transcriptional repressor LexA